MSLGYSTYFCISYYIEGNLFWFCFLLHVFLNKFHIFLQYFCITKTYSSENVMSFINFGFRVHTLCFAIEFSFHSICSLSNVTLLKPLLDYRLVSWIFWLLKLFLLTPLVISLIGNFSYSYWLVQLFQYFNLIVFYWILILLTKVVLHTPFIALTLNTRAMTCSWEKKIEDYIIWSNIEKLNIFRCMYLS